MLPLWSCPLWLTPKQQGLCLTRRWPAASQTQTRIWTLRTWDIWRGHSLGTCAFLDFTMIQWNMAHVFLDYYMEAEDNIPRSWRKELLWEDGNFETYKYTLQRRWKTVCAADLITDKEMGNYRAWFWLIAWRGSKGRAESCGRTGL